jgi:1,4-dihydroxy-2-naphthoate octaprenyltransferase
LTETGPNAPSASPPAEPSAGKLWLMSLRAPFLIASLIPATLGIVLAHQQVGAFNGELAALTLVGIAAIHLSNSMMNDNFDFRSGADQAVEHKNPFAGGSRVLLAGKISLRAHLAAAFALLAIGVALGLLLVFRLGGPSTQAGQLLLAIGVVGVGSSVFYVGPPLRLAHYGVGEVAVGLSFGPLIVLGSYVVQAGALTMTAVWMSLAMGFIITAILWINEFPDVPSDLKAGKKTLMARLGTQRSVRVYEALILAAFACPVAAWLLASAPPTVLIALVTAPIAGKAIAVARKHHSEPMALIPANGMTIMLTALFGVLLIVGLAVAPFLPG